MGLASVQALAEEVSRQDFSVCEGFLDPERSAALYAEARALQVEGEFRAAGIGHGAERRTDVRGDELAWITPERMPLAWSLVHSELEALRLAINARSYLGLHEFEGHYAIFPPGAFYARHLDRFRDGNQRVASVVLYLNESWDIKDGGEIRLFPPALKGGDVTVPPRAGTLACFLSECVSHEVLPTRRLRYSLAGWFRRRV